MKQQLCIGILLLNEPWEAILTELGVCYKEVNFTKKLLQEYSVIIINKAPDPEERNHLHEFLKNGGSVVELKDARFFTHREHLSTTWVKTVKNSSSYQAFHHIPLLDIHEEVQVHQESRLFGGIIHFQVWKRGVIGFLGVNLPNLLYSNGYKRKLFYSEVGKNPDEIVSRVSKHELLEAFEAVLKELHFRRNLPYAKKWTSPTKHPVFCFRIDSDFGDSESIHNLYQILDKHQISGTWFLHVKAHEAWLDQFHSFENQELALHGYEHGTSGSVSKIRSNIQKGLNKLKAKDIRPSGFCAPYAIWNKALEVALTDFSFTYTSEFTFKYDGAPSRSSTPNMPLQIPIHPICTGSLSRIRYQEAEMAAYFAHILEQKKGRFNPIIFYHHPLQPGLKVLDHVFELVNTYSLTKMTFNEYASFWKIRAAREFQVLFDLENRNAHLEYSSDADQFIQVSFSHDRFDLLKPGESVDAQKIAEFEYSNSYLPSIKEIKNLRKPSLRVMKTSLIDWKNRIRL